MKFIRRFMIMMVMLKMIKMMLMLMLIVGLTQILIPDHNSVTRTRKPQPIHKRNLFSPYLCIYVQTDHYMCLDLEKYSVSCELKVGQFKGKPISPALQCTKNICIENRSLCGQIIIFQIMWTDNNFPNFNVDR